MKPVSILNRFVLMETAAAVSWRPVQPQRISEIPVYQIENPLSLGRRRQMAEAFARRGNGLIGVMVRWARGRLQNTYRAWLLERSVPAFFVPPLKAA